MIWQHRNYGIIVSRGTAWDTGPPIWPFQTPEILLAALNAPAYLITTPVFFLVRRLRNADERNLLLLLVILFLWFCVGSRIDFGLLPQDWAHHAMCPTVPLLFTLLASYSTGIYLFVGGVMWCSMYGRLTLPSFLSLMRVAGALPWCCLLAVAAMRGLICLQTGP
jgi:hypothetical protein